MKNTLDAERKNINKIDKKIARLFEKRMDSAGKIARYKSDNNMPIYVPEREEALIKQNSELISKPEYKSSYVKFQKNIMSLSRRYQNRIIIESDDKNDSFTCLDVTTENSSYPIFIGRSLIDEADKYLALDRRVFIVTDDGVPDIYAGKIKELCKHATVMTVKSGEESKSIQTLMAVLDSMKEAEIDRTGCVVAVGGGVVGDLAGLAASLYMRGIDFYNVPTTSLSQLDSSIGGKTAVNLGGVKNLIGAFNQPKAVLIDVNTLSTLPLRHLRSGLCEAVKMAITFNKDLFKLFEVMSEDEIYERIDEIIAESLKIKRHVVEMDEKENGIRRVLNFGHTIGHGIESQGGRYHGECVALGMLPMCADNVRERLMKVLEKLGVPTSYDGDIDRAITLATHDKKRCGDGIIAIFCNEIGTYEINSISLNDLDKITKRYFV